MWNEQGRVFSYDEQYRSVTCTYCFSAAVVQYKYDTVQAVLYSVVLYNTTLQSTQNCTTVVKYLYYIIYTLLYSNTYCIGTSLPWCTAAVLLYSAAVVQQ